MSQVFNNAKKVRLFHLSPDFFFILYRFTSIRRQVFPLAVIFARNIVNEVGRNLLFRIVNQCKTYDKPHRRNFCKVRFSVPGDLTFLPE